jgi:hypothetical protein
MLLDLIYSRREDGHAVVILTVQAQYQLASHISTSSPSLTREKMTNRTVLWLSMSFDGGQERIMMKANVATYNIPESSKEYFADCQQIESFYQVYQSSLALDFAVRRVTPGTF